jgi:hypothetical protein
VYRHLRSGRRVVLRRCTGIGPLLSEISERIEADDIKFVVLRLKRVRHPDVVCIERIEHFLREETARG